MIEGYVIDWSVVAALFAAMAAFVAAGVTYFTAQRRNELDARIEICRYHEKRLDKLRSEMAMLSALYFSTIGQENPEEDANSFSRHMSEISLLVDESNQHWRALDESMADMFVTLGTPSAGLKKDVLFVGVCRKIIEQEKQTIQRILNGNLKPLC